VDEISLAGDEGEATDAGSVGVVLEVDQSEPEDVMNIKRGSDGQPLAKNQKTGPQIQDLLNPSREVAPEQPSKKSSKKKTKTSTRKKKTPAKKKTNRKNEKQLVKENASQYDLLMELANASSGMTFGQLLKETQRTRRNSLTRYSSRVARGSH